MDHLRHEARVRPEAVELVREQARIIGGAHLAAFDGGFALASVVRPLVAPEGERPRIEFLTRLRHDARLYAPLPHRHRPNRKWGKKLPPPRQGGEDALARTRDELAAFKREVARTYVPLSLIRDVDQRLTQQLLRIEEKLEAATRAATAAAAAVAARRHPQRGWRNEDRA